MSEFEEVRNLLIDRIVNWQPLPSSEIANLAVRTICLLDKLKDENMELRENKK